MTKILDGKILAQAVKSDIKNTVESYLAKGKRAPCLAVILVGEDPASRVYVGNKAKFAKECLFETIDIKLPADCSQQQVESAIRELNENSTVDGILLQLPLPAGLKSEPLLSLIDPDKDADGLHPLNQGLLMRGEGTLRPCTPSGCMLMIDLALSNQDPQHIEFQKIKAASLAGKNAVVIGRSVLVGKPVALMLLERNASVTVVHSRTKNIEQICRQADILIAAVGKAKMVNAEWIKQGAIAIDVGINRTPDGKLCGDLDFESVRNLCSAITPVPGGVGPMTVAYLIKNTLNSYINKING